MYVGETVLKIMIKEGKSDLPLAFAFIFVCALLSLKATKYATMCQILFCENVF